MMRAEAMMDESVPVQGPSELTTRCSSTVNALE